jgi:uncharacterized membrane protein YbhN (UPF0104 family)|tara:strand:- start:706 stop:939 length:234 start_codon:yes stop_codon:yes gene_type:complete
MSTKNYPMKKTGIIAIIIGLAIWVLYLISVFWSFLFSHPFLGLALIAIIGGAVIIILDIYQEKEKDKENEPFRGIEK